jgi:hypothetical protein
MSAPPKLPTYVEYGPRESSPPPFQSQGGRFLFCDLQGDVKKITKMCNAMLNTPAKGRVVYKPKDGTVVMMAGTWRGLSSLPMVGRGQVNEVQVALMVPLIAERPSTKERHVAAMLPYVFVDNPLSLINGREDYGYQKALAKFHSPPLSGENISVRAYGGRFARTSVAKWVPVLSFEPITGEPASPGPLEPPDSVAEKVALAAAHGMSPRTRVSVLTSIVDALTKGTATQVFLKQFRDAEVAGAACYQKVVEVPVKMTVTTARTMFSQWRVTINSPNSHPITKDLGVQSETVTAVGEFEASLELKPGHVV